jgi:hypothetical protein
MRLLISQKLFLCPLMVSIQLLTVQLPGPPIALFGFWQLLQLKSVIVCCMEI